ncbi:MAG: universal stress protein E [Candidatus Azotimanducaceae bacterium]|jgi:universal stress protein E
MFKKVMVVIDSESDHQVALDKALRFARVDDFELVLLSCDHTEYLVEGYYFDAVEVKPLRAAYIAERRSKLEEIAEPLRQNGLLVTTISEWAYPNYQGVVEKATELEADLILHHVKRHGALSRFFLRHDDWQLMRYSPAPLLLVKNRPWQDELTLIAAVDPQHARHKPSGLDHKILNVSQKIADMMAGKVVAVHAYRAVPFSSEYPRDAAKIHKKSFNTLMDDFNLPLEQQMLIEASPAFGLQQAENSVDADIVVMGGISRSLVADVMIGSTTEKVIDFLKSDVLVLKPNDIDLPDPRRKK